MKALPALVFLLPLMSTAANYSAEKVSRDHIETVRLTDASRKTEVSIVPSIGNNAFEMKVNGKNIFYFPFQTLTAFQEKPTLAGNPLLSPWANRLDHNGFYASGKHYSVDPELKNVRFDGHKQPIHGLLAFAKEWKIIRLDADANSASVESQLEFWRYPDYMAQFPFAHTLTMTYRLSDGVLEVETKIDNHSTEAMPVSVGFHPYFELHDTPRDQWKVDLPVKQEFVLSPQLVPTGAMRPFTRTSPMGLAGTQLDDVFGGLAPSADGKVEFAVQGGKERIAVVYGPKYPVAVVYAPPGKNFICFEPMSGPTNAFNLHHAGKYEALQMIAPGAKWAESFWIRPSGF
jgi:aldose 1-epimerase